MTPVDIAWTVSLILWLIFAIMNFIANRYNATALAQFSLTLEWICLAFMWLFIGFNHGWW